MAQLRIDLQEGFIDDTVEILLNGRQVFHRAGVNTRLQIGLADSVELEISEANRATPNPPYQSLVNMLNREMTKAWLGQTLTVDMADQGGSKAAAEVHDRVRRDILLDDIRKEGRTIRRDILRPLAQFKFGLDVPVPFFRRKPDPGAPGRDLRELADVLSVAVNDLGIKAPTRWVHDTLGIPEPQNAEAVLSRPERVEGFKSSGV